MHNLASRRSHALFRDLCLLFLFGSAACACSAAPAAPAGSAPYRKALAEYEKNKNYLPKILDGEDAHHADFPWQVALVRADIADNFYAHFCGGVLIGDGWVITAAHCVDSGMSGGMLRVVVGTDILQGNTLREEVEDHIAIADDYDPVSYRNDVGLLQLKSARPTARISMLTQQDDTLTDANPPKITVLGWGYIHSWGLKSRQLKQLDLALPTLNECQRVYGNRVSSDMFCAGKGAGGKDACRGDSGGAAVVKSAAGAQLLAGLVSWGIGCGDPNRYGIYARLSRFQEWIEEQQRARPTTQATH